MSKAHTVIILFIAFIVVLAVYVMQVNNTEHLEADEITSEAINN